MTEILDIKEFESLDINGIGTVELGLTIEHPSLGLGTVENISQIISSGAITIKINFDEYGLKNINPKHAHLTFVEKPDNKSFLKGLFKGMFNYFW